MAGACKLVEGIGAGDSIPDLGQSKPLEGAAMGSAAGASTTGASSPSSFYEYSSLTCTREAKRPTV